MAQETELERLVIRFGADVGGFVNGVKEVQAAATSAGNAMTNLASAATNALAAIGLGGGLQAMFSAFSEAERGDIRLRAALEANGRQVEELTVQYQEWASMIQRVTTLDDDAAKSLLRTAETFGLTGSAAQTAAQNAISLAAATGTSAEGMIRLTAALAEGDTERAMRFARMVPQLRGVTDETEFLTKVNQLLITGWRTAGAEAQTASGRITQLKNAIGDLMEEFGAIVAEGIKPFVEGLKEVVRWFAELDKGAKTTIVAFVGLLGAILAWQPAVFIVTALGTALKGVIAAAVALLGPFTAVGAAIAAAFGAAQFDSLTEFWDWMKERASASLTFVRSTVSGFIEWFGPIWRAAAGVVSAVWEGIKDTITTVIDIVSAAFRQFVNTVGSLFSSIAGMANVTWTSVRNFIVGTLIAAEFSVRNFGAVTSLVFTGAKLSFVTFANEVHHFFTSTLPTFLNWFGTNWRAIFTDVWNWTTTVFMNLGRNIVEIFKNIPGLIAGTVRWSEVWRPLQEGFIRTSTQLVVPERQRGAIEQQLIDQFRAQSDALGESYAAFRERRLREIGINPSEAEAMENQASEVGSTIGDAFGKSAAKSADKVEYVLFDSAEALAHISAYTDALEDIGHRRRRGGRGGGRVGEAVLAGEAGARERIQAQETIQAEGPQQLAALLSTANEHLARIAGRSTVEVEEVDLSEGVA